MTSYNKSDLTETVKSNLFIALKYWLRNNHSIEVDSEDLNLLDEGDSRFQVSNEKHKDKLPSIGQINGITKEVINVEKEKLKKNRLPQHIKDIIARLELIETRIL